MLSIIDRAVNIIKDRVANGEEDIEKVYRHFEYLS